mmetsp:Transcript_7141/g.12751  ORF Transcript_7141/g.12751 Transcript_7141/m.12751 type:complete len:375 (-) Transcript_7141:2552-3676(-)
MFSFVGFRLIADMMRSTAPDLTRASWVSFTNAQVSRRNKIASIHSGSFWYATDEFAIWTILPTAPLRTIFPIVSSFRATRWSSDTPAVRTRGSGALGSEQWWSKVAITRSIAPPSRICLTLESIRARFPSKDIASSLKRGVAVSAKFRIRSMASLTAPHFVASVAPVLCSASAASAPSCAVTLGWSCEFSFTRPITVSTTPALTSLSAADERVERDLTQSRTPIFSVGVTFDAGAFSAFMINGVTPRLSASGAMEPIWPRARNPARRAYSRSFMSSIPPIVLRPSTKIAAAFLFCIIGVFSFVKANAPTVAAEIPNFGNTFGFWLVVFNSATSFFSFSISASTPSASIRRERSRAPIASMVSDQGYISIAFVTA